MGSLYRHLCLGLLILPLSSPVYADSDSLTTRGCATLAQRVDDHPGSGPIFLASFDDADNPALKTVAFTYDNGLAIIALIACGKDQAADRLGRALLAAANAPGRLKNAYRAGPPELVPLPNGWWNAERLQWQEDGYQLGSATGNVAWAGLALLTLAERGGDQRYRAAAAELGRWIIDNGADQRGAGGFTGGIFGGAATPKRELWKATEHNVDAAALFLWLARVDHSFDWAGQAEVARRFLDSQWDKDGGHFVIGTGTDGISENRASSGLDAQFWPLLLPDAPAEWRRAIIYAEQAHGVTGGFSFTNDHGGLWTEGTAQAALAFRQIGETGKASRALASVAAQISPTGYMWATPEARLATGLAIGPDSSSADFFYFHLPHLGATAWAVIAAIGWNPFIGRLVPGQP
jgi:hypothetical protein